MLLPWDVAPYAVLVTICGEVVAAFCAVSTALDLWQRAQSLPTYEPVQSVADSVSVMASAIQSRAWDFAACGMWQILHRPNWVPERVPPVAVLPE